MPNSYPTLATIVSGQLGLADIEVSNLTNAAPFVGILPAEESSDGILHKYSRETDAPTVGFRRQNAGRYFSASGNELVTIDLEVLDWSHAMDKATADGYPSSKGGREAALAKEGNAHLRAAFSAYEK